MTIMRIVTGHDQAGNSTIISHKALAGTEPFTHSPGFSAALVWQTEPQASIVDQPEDPCSQSTSVIPAPGGSSAMLVTFPPDANFGADFDPVAAGAELCQRLPGLGELFEPDAPGFHRTDSIDYGVVLEGEITLELDGGCTRVLRQGDILIQTGTRHAWRNLTDSPARLLFVLIGAKRS